MNPEVREALELGRANIASGWGQAGKTQHRRVQHCIVTSMTWIESPIFYKALNALGFMGVEDAATWNDAPERTKKEVLARFDGALS